MDKGQSSKTLPEELNYEKEEKVNLKMFRSEFPDSEYQEVALKVRNVRARKKEKKEECWKKKTEGNSS